MKINHFNTPLFYISLENVFSEGQFKKVYDEIISLKSKFKEPEYTGSATLHNNILKKNTGIFLLDELEEQNSEVILSINTVLKKIKRDNWKSAVFKRIFNVTMWGGELINCYEDSDYYIPHIDDGIFTLIIWMWDKNSNFEGGDLYFPEYDYLHKCKNNHGILFFSKELHGVTTLKTNIKNNNRYSIVSFSQMVENDNTEFKEISSKKTIKYE